MRGRAYIGLLLLGLLAGCGRSGFPVPPDDYGIGLRMQQERQKEEQARKEQETQAKAAPTTKAGEEPVAPADEIMLPDMRPVGGR